MQTSNRPRPTTIRRRAYGGPAYYLGRRADVWRSLRRYNGHPAAGATGRTPTLARSDAGPARS